MKVSEESFKAKISEEKEEVDVLVERDRRTVGGRERERRTISVEFDRSPRKEQLFPPCFLRTHNIGSLQLSRLNHIQRIRIISLIPNRLSRVDVLGLEVGREFEPEVGVLRGVGGEGSLEDRERRSEFDGFRTRYAQLERLVATVFCTEKRRG